MSRVITERIHSPEADLGVLQSLLTELRREKESAAFKISEIYRQIFERTGTGPKVFTFSPARQWEGSQLERALGLIEEVVVHYVRLFQDPREIPVTYYARQKRVAIHLDEEFSKLLRQAVRSFSRDSFENEDGQPVADAFLDKPILFLKQEARGKGFPKTKRAGDPA